MKLPRPPRCPAELLPQIMVRVAPIMRQAAIIQVRPSSWLEPVELAVRNRLIPALTSGSPPNDSLRGVLAQPCRLGGLGIVDATTLCQQHQSSVLITSGLVNLIKNKEQHLGDELHLLRNRRNSIRQTTRQSQRAVMAGLLGVLPGILSDQLS